MKIAAAAGSTGAAVVSFLYSYGIAGDAEAHRTIGNYGAAWIGLQPAVDTAESIGDTLHLAATITDQNGTVLVGARPTWSSSDSRVAVVLPDGSVIARSSGATTIVAVVGDHTAKSRVVVRQRVAAVSIEADSAISLPEGHRHQLQVRAADARGYTVPGRVATWRIDDTTVVALDSTGMIEGLVPGRAVANATIDDVSGHGLINVISIPASLTLVNGNIPRLTAGSTLPEPIIVRVLSRTGHPVEGSLVRFRRADGAGPAEGAVGVTDMNGRARTTWTLGTFPGRQTLLATVEHVDSALAIVAEVDPVAANTRVTPLTEERSGTVGMAIADPVGIRLSDTTGRPLADVPVSWTTLDGTIEGLTARTDSLGIALARWTLGDKSGVQEASATIGSTRAMPPFIVSARALPGVAARAEIASGDAQRSTAGASLSKPVVVIVRDSKGNPVPNAVLAVSPLAGTVRDSTLRTDSTGRATIRWTMGRMAGPHALSVKPAGVDRALRVTATAASGVAENLSIEPVVMKGRPASSRDRKFVAIVSDIYGNPVTGARVSLATKSGTVTPANAVTDAKGRVTGTWKLAAKAEEQTLRATVRGTKTTGALVLTGPAPAPAASATTKAPTAKTVRKVPAKTPPARKPVRKSGT